MRTAITGEIASLFGAADDPRYFQISVPVQPGNSGGALVEERKLKDVVMDAEQVVVLVLVLWV